MSGVFENLPSPADKSIFSRTTGIESPIRPSPRRSYLLTSFLLAISKPWHDFKPFHHFPVSPSQFPNPSSPPETISDGNGFGLGKRHLVVELDGDDHLTAVTATAKRIIPK